MVKKKLGSELYIIQYFYQQDRLVTQMQAQSTRVELGTGGYLLAQLRFESNAMQAALLGTDAKHSVLMAVVSGQRQGLAYLPYGYHPGSTDLSGLPSFNGETRDSVTGHYLLGAGYRLYNSVLMRFQSVDSLSPFSTGGLNYYMYCHADPVNFSDPNGHSLVGMLVGGANRTRPRGAGVSLIPKPFNRANNAHSTLATPPGSSRSLRRSISVDLRSDAIDAEFIDAEFIGFHGSTNLDAKTLKAGLVGSFMDRASGLSSGRGFYVAPTHGMAVDFAEVAASYRLGSQPKVFYVEAINFTGKIPNRHYRFGTMGEGGVGRIRNIGEMELLIRETMYSSIRIREIAPNRPLIRPRSSEAPF
jgi:RHS repeat-associated protein